MKKLFFIFLFGSSLFAQQLDWGDQTVNFPTSKDDTTSVIHATANVDTVKAVHINRILRMIRLLQDKVGVGGSLPSISGSVLTVNAGGDSTSWTIPSTNLQWQILAPTIAYQQGDSLLSVHLTSSANVYYDLGKILSTYDGGTITIDSLWMVIKGDASSYVDSVKVYSAADDTVNNMTVQYVYRTPAQCNSTIQTRVYPINLAFPANQILLLRVWYTVSSYLKTIRFRIFASI
jgi:hypothetical protein